MKPPRLIARCVAPLFLLLCLQEGISGASDLSRVWSSIKEHAAIPSDPEYWRFQRRYVRHSVLDVIVSGGDVAHLEEVLKEVQKLQEKGVLLGKIVVVGGHSFSFLQRTSRSKLDDKEMYRNLQSALRASRKQISPGDYRVLKRRLGLAPRLTKIADALQLAEGTQLPNTEVLLREFDIRRSPTWIITTRGKQLTYEGYSSVARYFAADGSLRSDMSAPGRSKHLVDKSGAPFVPEKKRKKAERESKEEPPLISMQFDMQPWRILPGAGTYDVMPGCRESSVRRVKVRFDSRELQHLDILYYAFHDMASKKRAKRRVKKRQGLSVPYLPGDLVNPRRVRDDLSQKLARLLDIRCLPTRVHYVVVDGQRFEEYREHESAWED